MAALPRHLASLRQWFAAPSDVRLVCEIAGDYVAAVRHHHGRVESWAVRSLPEGAVRAAPLSENLANPGAVQEALEHVVGAVADGQRRTVLLIPDLLARVAVLEFDTLPNAASEIEALLRWRLSKDLPFDVGQAALSYQVQPGRGTARELLVAVCLRSFLHHYEECVERLGLEPGRVMLSGLAAAGCLEASAGSARLLAKRDPQSLSLVIVHDGAVRLFRSLPLPDGAASEAAWLEKLYPALVYFQDQWGQPVGQVVLASGGRAAPGLAQRLEQETGCAVTEQDTAGLECPPSPVSGATPDYRLLPSLGWLRGGAR